MQSLITHRGAEAVNRSVKAPSPVIVPLDGSPGATEALNTAMNVAATRGSGLILVRAVEPMTDLPAGTPELGRARARREYNLRRSQAEGYLAVIKRWLDSHGVEARVLIEDGEEADVPLRLAQSTPGAVVVLQASLEGGSQDGWNSRLVAALRKLDLPLVIASAADPG